MLVPDTNVVSELMRPRPDRRVIGWIARQPVETMAVTAITVMEIGYGIALLADGAGKRGLEGSFDQFLARGFAGRTLAFDLEAAETSAAIRSERRRIGRSAGTEDCMIAGIALRIGATVVTRDEKGFAGHGVPVVNPWAGATP